MRRSSAAAGDAPGVELGEQRHGVLAGDPGGLAELADREAARVLGEQARPPAGRRRSTASAWNHSPSRSTSTPRRASSRSSARSTPSGAGGASPPAASSGDDRVVGRAGRPGRPAGRWCRRRRRRRAWRARPARARRARPARGRAGRRRRDVRRSVGRGGRDGVGGRRPSARPSARAARRSAAPARRRRPSPARRRPGRRSGRAGPATPAAPVRRRAPRRRRRSRRARSRAARTGRPAAAAAPTGRCSRTAPVSPGAQGLRAEHAQAHGVLARADVGEVGAAPGHVVVERWRARSARRRRAPSSASGRRRRRRRHGPASLCSTPARLSATRWPGPIAATTVPMVWIARTLAGRPPGSTATWSPVAIEPSVSVPVTTVPLPARENDAVDPQPRPAAVARRRRRAGEVAERRGELRRRRRPPARRPARPAPRRGTCRRGGRRPRGAASSTSSRSSSRSTLVRATTPWRTPTSSRIRRCSSLCGFQPSVAATTNRQASTPPTPASMLRRNRTWPGTSTKLIASPSMTAWAKPRSIVSPRRFSSAKRSGSVPVSASTSDDLPWSTCPAVAITRIAPHCHPARCATMGSARGRRGASMTAEPVRIEVTLPRPIAEVWPAFRDPALIRRWHGWDDDDLDAEIQDDLHRRHDRLGGRPHAAHRRVTCSPSRRAGRRPSCG